MTDTITSANLADWLRRFSDTIHEQATYLTELDSAIGDADHGANMDRGMRAVVAMLESTGIVTTPQERGGVKSMLTAAALTYVAAALTAILTLLYYLSLARRSN